MADEAAACCIGAIGQAATNREDFIKGGLIFLDRFKGMAETVIDDRSQGDCINMELIDEIKILIDR